MWIVCKAAFVLLNLEDCFNEIRDSSFNRFMSLPWYFSLSFFSSQLCCNLCARVFLWMHFQGQNVGIPWLYKQKSRNVLCGRFRAPYYLHSFRRRNFLNWNELREVVLGIYGMREKMVGSMFIGETICLIILFNLILIWDLWRFWA